MASPPFSLSPPTLSEDEDGDGVVGVFLYCNMKGSEKPDQIENMSGRNRERRSMKRGSFLIVILFSSLTHLLFTRPFPQPGPLPRVENPKMQTPLPNSAKTGTKIK